MFCGVVCGECTYCVRVIGCCFLCRDCFENRVSSGWGFGGVCGLGFVSGPEDERVSDS